MTSTIQDAITFKLTSMLSPQFLQVFNESYKHNVPKDSETHFKVVIVSERFIDQSLIARHRLVNKTLQQELLHGVHALSIQAVTPSEWSQDNTINKTPSCLGGGSHVEK
jgi:BolA protein